MTLFVALGIDLGTVPAPKAVAFWGMPPGGLAIRPGELGWTTDLGASFNGARGSNSGRGADSNLSWSRWSATGANGGDAATAPQL